MSRETAELKRFQRWFGRYVAKGYGKKCRDFTWSCAVCHAHFVKGLLDDFIEDTAATETWARQQQKASK